MVFKALYTRWDEMYLRSNTAEREKKLRDRWESISRLGALRFTLLLGSVLSVLFVAYGELLWLIVAPHQWTWSIDLIYWAMLGFAVAPAYYFVIKGRVTKLDTWRAAGRL